MKAHPSTIDTQLNIHISGTLHYIQCDSFLFISLYIWTSSYDRWCVTLAYLHAFRRIIFTTHWNLGSISWGTWTWFKKVFTVATSTSSAGSQTLGSFIQLFACTHQSDTNLIAEFIKQNCNFLTTKPIIVTIVPRTGIHATILYMNHKYETALHMHKDDAQLIHHAGSLRLSMKSVITTTQISVS